MKATWAWPFVVVALIGAIGSAATRPGDPAAAKTLLKKHLGAPETPKEQIEALIRSLGHDDFAARERATRELIAIGEAARPLLEQAAKSDDPEVRWRAALVLHEPEKKHEDASADLGTAIDALAAAGDKWLVPTLIHLLGHSRTDVRYAAEYGLRRTTRQGFAYCAYATDDARRAAAAKWLAWWKRAEATFAFSQSPPLIPRPAAILISSRKAAKVWMIDLAGKTLWKKEVEGQLSRAKALANGNKIIAYRGRGVVEELDPKGKVVWTTEGTPLRGDVYDIQRLPNGNTLIAHASGNKLLEFDPAGKVVWTQTVNRMPISVQRLPSGNTLVAVLYGLRWHAGGANGRVVEVTRSGEIVWQKEGLNMPTDAVKLPNGRVLLTEQGQSRVIEIDRNGQVVWEVKCDGRPNSARRLPNGTTVINDTSKGILLVGKDGEFIRLLDKQDQAGKISLVPATVSQRSR